MPASWQDNPELVLSREEMLFFWYALQHNIIRQLGELFDLYAETKELNSMNTWYVSNGVDEAYAGDKEVEDIEDRKRASMGFMAGQFWRDLSQLAKRTAAREYLEAAGHQDDSLLGGELEIEDIVLDPMPVLWRQKK
jgi:hypothetical protein